LSHLFDAKEVTVVTVAASTDGDLKIKEVVDLVRLFTT
jgi:hypothetical protein